MPETLPKDKSSGYVGCVLRFIFFLSGIGVLGYECYWWLRYGYWKGISVLSLLKTASDWKTSTDWIGFYKLLDHIPLFVALIFLAFLFPDLD